MPRDVSPPKAVADRQAALSARRPLNGRPGAAPAAPAWVPGATGVFYAALSVKPSLYNAKVLSLR